MPGGRGRGHRAARPTARDEPREVVAATDEDGRFEVRREPGVALRVIVADAVHEPCIRDLDAGRQRGRQAGEIDCLVAKRARRRRTRRACARPPPTQAVTRYTLSQPELTTVPGTFGDPLRVMQNLPGVARTPFGLGLLVIRGASPKTRASSSRGTRSRSSITSWAGPSVLTPRLIDRIDFFPGNFGVKYGRATAGIVDVGIKTDATPRLHGHADINLLDSSAYVEGPLGNGVVGLGLGAAVVHRPAAAARAPEQHDHRRARLLGLPGRRAPRLPAGRLALFAFGSNDTLQGDLEATRRRATSTSDTRSGSTSVIAIWTASSRGWVNKLSPAVRLRAAELRRRARSRINQSRLRRSSCATSCRASSPRASRCRVGFDGEIRRRATSSSTSRSRRTRASTATRSRCSMPSDDPARHAGGGALHRRDLGPRAAACASSRACAATTSATSARTASPSTRASSCAGR